jgi:hypothetical protein
MLAAVGLDQRFRGRIRTEDTWSKPSEERRYPLTKVAEPCHVNRLMGSDVTHAVEPLFTPDVRALEVGILLVE